jgi:hypothetical protein
LLVLAIPGPQAAKRNLGSGLAVTVTGPPEEL